VVWVEVERGTKKPGLRRPPVLGENEKFNDDRNLKTWWIQRAETLKSLRATPLPRPQTSELIAKLNEARSQLLSASKVPIFGRKGRGPLSLIDPIERLGLRFTYLYEYLELGFADVFAFADSEGWHSIRVGVDELLQTFLMMKAKTIDDYAEIYGAIAALGQNRDEWDSMAGRLAGQPVPATLRVKAREKAGLHGTVGRPKESGTDFS
jgi:hypothetical protein